MSKTYDLTSAVDRAIEFKTWYSPDYDYTLKVKSECYGAVATFLEPPLIPSDYSEVEGIEVFNMDGIDNYDCSSYQILDEIVFIDEPPEEEKQKVLDAWEESMTGGLEDLGWTESDTEVYFYGPLNLNGKRIA